MAAQAVAVLHVVTVATVAVKALLVGTVLLVTHNARLLTVGIGVSLHLLAYLFMAAQAGRPGIFQAAQVVDLGCMGPVTGLAVIQLEMGLGLWGVTIGTSRYHPFFGWRMLAVATGTGHHVAVGPTLILKGFVGLGVT